MTFRQGPSMTHTTRAKHECLYVHFTYIWRGQPRFRSLPVSINASSTSCKGKVQSREKCLLGPTGRQSSTYYPGAHSSGSANSFPCAREFYIVLTCSVDYNMVYCYEGRGRQRCLPTARLFRSCCPSTLSSIDQPGSAYSFSCAGKFVIVLTLF